MRVLLSAAALAVILASGPSSAADFATLYDAGTRARLEGRHAEAEALLERALVLAPDDPDALVQLGYARLALDDVAGAEGAFRRALDRAPDYLDARRGLAQVSLRTDRADDAVSIYEGLPSSDRIAADVLSLGDAYRAAGREADARRAYRSALVDPSIADQARGRLVDPDYLRSRVDVDFSASALDGAAEDWREGTFRLATRVSANLAFSAGAEVAHRFGSTDVLIDLGVDRRFGDALSGYVWIGGTPSADFRPEIALGFGGSARLREGGAALGTTVGMISLRHDLYDESRVTTAQLGFDQSFHADRLSLSTRAIAVVDDAGESAFGWSIRANASITDRIETFAGYADAPEIEAGTFTDVRSLSAGVSYMLSERTELRVSFGHEDRAKGSDRRTMTAGLTFRF